MNQLSVASNSKSVIKNSLWSFGSYWGDISPIPTGSVLLGRCEEDGKPVYWDIANRMGYGKTGPLEVRGDLTWCRYIIFTIVSSLVMNNGDGRKVVVISRNPEEWNSFYQKFGYDSLLTWMKVIPSYKEEAETVLSYVSEYAVTHNPWESEKIVFVVDDYSGLFMLNTEFILDFKRLLQHTSESVAVITTVEPNMSVKIPLSSKTIISQNSNSSFFFEDANHNYNKFTFSPLDYSV